MHPVLRSGVTRDPRLTLAVSLAGLLVCAACVSAPADEIKQQMTAAVTAVRPALVRIHVVSVDYRQGRELKMESFGSGVIISPEGYVVTNHHVASDAERIVCTLADKTLVDAKLVGTDPMADIAVIKLISSDGKPFPSAHFGDSDKLTVGDTVFAMGCPLALSQSVTAGMVSNTEMIMPDYFSMGEFTLEGEDVGSIVRWIGHDALIRPGNSGGPLVNRGGEIVGINEISFGLSGAIPSNLAKVVVSQLIDTGKVTRSWLGLEVQPVLESSGVENGILVSGVLDDSPAAEAGFRSGDILTSLAGHPVTAKFREEVPIFNQFVADLPVGKPVEAQVLRDGEMVKISVTTAEREKAKDKRHELRDWGITATNITYVMEKEMQLPGQDGVVVTGVLPSGPSGAAKPSLEDEDVMLRVGDQIVKDIAHLREITRKLTESSDEPVPVIVQFLRKKKHYATVVKVGKKEAAKPGSQLTKAWLPVDMQVLTRELAQALGIPDATGVRVTQVHGNSDNGASRLQVGDLILKLDGETIPAEQIGDEEVLPSLVRQYDIGAEVKLGIIRDGQPMDVTVKLRPSPKPKRDYPKYEDDNFEFTVRDIAFDDMAAGDVEEGQTGAYVDGVSEGSWAALAKMRSGDVITEVNGAKVSGMAELKQAMTRIGEAKPDVVVFKVIRGIHTMYLEVEPAWIDAESRSAQL
ncbi:MAG: hypothetical protein A2Z18_00590 [Armatimonadetes bacterium RBG_16_58_9]|nr:MAG: hypothetical protein A2Z18_00590 [Armatimonadetes bacterium RBG_16_58_9]